jgi:S1-C subfamily serine protease
VRRAALVAAAAIGFACAAPARADERREDAVARAAAVAARAVVRVEARDASSTAESAPAGAPWRDDAIPELPPPVARYLPGEVEMASGVIISPDGYILTSGALFRDAARHGRVLLQDGRHLEAVLIGRDGVLDVAILKIAARGLPCAELADSDGVRPGELVIALGDPFGIALDGAPSASAGIVSAVRPVPSDETKYTGPMIETDAAINPGVQGGPLVDLDGRVIGLCSPLLRSRATDCLVACAVPSNAIRARLLHVRLGGRPYLGVVLREDARAGSGAQVEGVVPGSPAAAADIRPNDRIIGFAARPIASAKALVAAIEATKAGDTVRIRVERAGRVFEVDVVIARRDF